MAATERALFELNLSFVKMSSFKEWLSGLSNPQRFLGKMRSLKVTHFADDDINLNDILAMCGRYADSLTGFDVTLQAFLRQCEWLNLTQSKRTEC